METCIHGEPIGQFQEDVRQGKHLPDYRPEDYRYHCPCTETLEAEAWERYCQRSGLELDDIEGRTYRGRITDVYVGTSEEGHGAIVIELRPQGHGTLPLDTWDYEKVATWKGRWCEFTLASASSIWHIEVEGELNFENEPIRINPSLFEIALDLAWVIRNHLRFYGALLGQVRHGPWYGFSGPHHRKHHDEPEPLLAVALRWLARTLHPHPMGRLRKRRKPVRMDILPPWPPRPVVVDTETHETFVWPTEVP